MAQTIGLTIKKNVEKKPEQTKETKPEKVIKK